MSPAPALVILDLAEIQQRVTLPAAVAAVEGALRALAAGDVVQPPPMGIDLPAGQIHVKAAQLGTHRPVVIKTATGFSDNAASGLPPTDGMMLAVDSGTGMLLAVLMDRGWLTDLRTAAATAVAVRLLSSGRGRRMALLGTGVQADLTLRALDAVGLLPSDVAVWGRTPERAHALAERHRYDGSRVAAVESAEVATRGADLVVTVTPSRRPILHGDWLGPDTLVVAVGADSIGKRECDPAVLGRAEHVVVDSVAQASLLGELQYAETEGTMPERVDELGELLAHPDLAPTNGIRLCDLTGLGAYDAAVTELVTGG